MSKRIISDERGRILAWTLVVLGLGSLLIPPLLTRVSASLIASRAIEEGLKEQYAADSGVEYALLQLQNGIATGQNSYTLNKKVVDVTWGEYVTATYKIISKATSHINGSSTTIESYVSLEVIDFSWLLENPFSGSTQVTIQSDSEAGGAALSSGTLDYDNAAIIPPSVGAEDTDSGPGLDDLSTFFFGQVEDLPPYPYETIDIATNSVGPLYRVGNLDIISSEDNLTGMIEGIVYVAGDLAIGQTNQDFRLNLNGQTIYVEGAVRIGDKCTILGSGCIIAEGDIFFMPYIESGADDFVFVMSVGGTSWMQPHGDFYGSMAGKVEVWPQPDHPNLTLTWTDPRESDLNFPDGTTGRVHIRTYHIYP